MKANDCKSYHSYLNKLVDEFNKSYHYSTDKKLIDTGFSALFDKIEMIPKAPKFKVGHRIKVTKYKNIFTKGCTENWSRELFVIDSVLKTNPWIYKINYLNGEKLVGSFYEKNSC